MIKSILVSIDYSEASLNALETATCIAKMNNAALEIMHVAETDWAYPEFNQPEIPTLTRQLAEAMRINIQSNHGIDAQTLFSKGFAGSAIVRRSRELRTDLIIMGTHGASGMRELVIGSNAYFVMKHASAPVLVIPEGNKYLHFENILLPFRTSFGTFKRSGFIKALSNGKYTELEVLALSVDKDSIEAYVSELINDSSHTVKEDLRVKLSIRATNDKNISREMLDRAERMQADLLILSPTLDVITKKLFIGPFCQRIINQTKTPILYIH